jgi:hypothetical protein
MSRRALEVTYSSDVMIANSEELAALAIFYDRVILPAATPESTPHFVELERLPGDVLRMFAFELSPSFISKSSGEIVPTGDSVTRWEQANHELFDDGVLVRLPAPDAADDGLDEWIKNSRTVSMSLGHLLQYRGTVLATTPLGAQIVLIRQDHLRHLLRSDLRSPAVFVAPVESRREVLKALQASETFRYLIPSVGKLRPDQILALREKVSATREGFAMHLQALSAEVESRLTGGETPVEIARYARAVVETKLLPDYHEFKRQLLADRSGFWLKVLETTRKVFEIEVPPWTPKFYGQIMAALGVSLLTSAEARHDSLSNRSQAFHFMFQVEESSSSAERAG